jgi:membrane fusion protein, heavy metal efflux system
MRQTYSRSFAVCLIGLLLSCQSKTPVTAEKAAKQEHGHSDHEAHDVELSEAAQRANGFAFATAEVRNLTGVIQATGVVTPNETRVAHIRPLARGRILRLAVRPGERVKQGQVLLSFDNIDLGETVGEFLRAGGAVQRARTESELAKRSLERANNLLESGAVARAEVERRQAEFRNTVSAIRAHQGEEARIHEKLHRYGLPETEIEALAKGDAAGFHREASPSMVRAPFDGTLIKAAVAEGETVGADQELFTLVDTATVWVLADIYERDIAGVREGAMASVTVNSFAGETFSGRITNVSDGLDPASRTAKVRVEVSNPARRLKFEMFANVTIPSGQSHSALVAPISAIQQVGGKPAVFVRESTNKFELREVELGVSRPPYVEILKGLSAGDVVVSQGGFILKSELAKAELAHEH